MLCLEWGKDNSPWNKLFSGLQNREHSNTTLHSADWFSVFSTPPITPEQMTFPSSSQLVMAWILVRIGEENTGFSKRRFQIPGVCRGCAEEVGGPVSCWYCFGLLPKEILCSLGNITPMPDHTWFSPCCGILIYDPQFWTKAWCLVQRGRGPRNWVWSSWGDNRRFCCLSVT